MVGPERSGRSVNKESGDMATRFGNSSVRDVRLPTADHPRLADWMLRSGWLVPPSYTDLEALRP